MKKGILISLFIISFSIGFEWNAIAQMPKEGTMWGTNIYKGTQKVFPFDKDCTVVLYENSGEILDDSTGGPFHKLATHNVGVIHNNKGIVSLRGYLTAIDKDGDKVIWELTEINVRPSPSNAVNGTAHIVGGTGKFTGIQGEMDYTRESMRPLTDGNHQATSKYKGNYKLP
jgi:hypothetical protein